MRRSAMASIGGAVVIAVAVVGMSWSGHQPDPPSWSIAPHDVIVGGDVTLDRDVARWILNGNNPFADIAPLLTEAEVVVVNLESPLTRSETPLDKEIVFRADPDRVDILKNGGVTTVTLANNHIGDFGPAGLDETLRVLHTAGIQSVGAGRSIGPATTPLIAAAGDARIALVNFSQYSGPTAPAAGPIQAGQAYYAHPVMERAIAKARAEADLVIALLHFGEEFQEYPTAEQQRKARAAIDMGADAVIGHHPHVTQGIENYRGKPIFYSIGNLVFDQETPPWDRSFLVALDVDDAGTPVYSLYPYRIVKTTPQFMSDGDADRFLTSINEISPEPLIEIANGRGFVRLEPWFSATEDG